MKLKVPGKCSKLISPPLNSCAFKLRGVRIKSRHGNVKAEFFIVLFLFPVEVNENSFNREKIILLAKITDSGVFLRVFK